VTGSKSRDGAEREGSEADRALVGLAREIQAEVANVGADVGGGHALVQALVSVPRRELARAAREVFQRLPVETQWNVLERVFDDDELRSALSEIRAERVAGLERHRQARALVGRAGETAKVDLRRLDAGSAVTFGLCTERDAGEAVARGHLYSSCARRIDLEHEGEGLFRVIRDVFNPLGGYFVTKRYDATAWEAERLVAHSFARVGSVVEPPVGPGFEPVVYAGGRADFEIEGRLVEGHLHVGYVMLGDVDLFVEGAER
jgi:hypothetical protein